MGYIPITPFRRAVKATVTQQIKSRSNPPAPLTRDKWKILRELATARRHYGLSDRDITVLQALLSFHKTTELDLGDSLIVHPSNQSICDRLNGMPCSTMRRHIARLVSTGIIARRDSPNGKRYVRRTGRERIAFGFDLGPFVARATEFAEAASAIRTAEQEIKATRERISLMRRDLAHLAEAGRDEQPDLPIWDQLSDTAMLTSRDLRRKLSQEDLALLEAKMVDALKVAKAHMPASFAAVSSTSYDQIEQDQYNSKKDSHEENKDPEKLSSSEVHDEKTPVPVTLDLVLEACDEIQVFTEKPIRSWDNLLNASERIWPMMGIGKEAWLAAQRQMGAFQAAAVVSAMLQRFDAIRSPDAYLKRLNSEAARGAFALKPVIMALVREKRRAVGSQL